MSKPLVSVIIPCYNQARFVGRAIHSCLDGNSLPLEIIVVDDGSIDDVQSALAEFGKTVKLIGRTKSGVSSARNAGLRVATGKFVKFLDADDWLFPGTLDRQVRILEQAQNSILVTGYCFSYEDGTRPDEDYYPTFGLWEASLAQASTSPIHAFLFPMDLVVDVGKFDETLEICEDYDFRCRAALIGVKTVALHSIECAYYRHVQNTTDDLEKTRKAFLIVWKRYFHLILENNSSIEIRIELLKSCAILMTHYPDDSSLVDIAKTLLADTARRLCSKVSIKDALDVAQAAAEVILMCPGGLDAIRESACQIFEKTFRLIDACPLNEYGRHMLQNRYFALAQTLLRGGEKRSARKLLAKVQLVGKNYGVNYVLLAKLQSCLGAFLPGAVAVALFQFINSLVESYWKYISKFTYKILCSSPGKESQ
jgi:GT2 family glycosyltransferase